MADATSCDIAIIGAGAAGLASAIFAAEAGVAAERPVRVALLDGARTLGAKILVSGGGRCNVTHRRVTPDDFFGPGPRPVIRNILAAFDERAAARWFESMGVRLKEEETGKLFPVSDSARTVLKALIGRCGQLGVGILPDHRVSGVRLREDVADGFEVSHAHGVLVCRRVILCTGGRSLPKTGSDGAGYGIAQGLGHTVTATHPALVPLVLEPAFFHASLSGLSHEAVLTVVKDNKVVDRRSGSLLWTHFGVSGPVAMDSSRHWLAAGAAAELRCGFLPGESFDNVENRLLGQAAARPTESVLRALASRLPERLAGVLLEHCGIPPATPLAHLARESRRRLVHALTGLRLPVVRDRGWNYAEVTAGGVPLAEVNFRTMESRKTPGLHLAGELLDCDGRIGGFNFQWAWATGYLAGRAAAKALVS